MKEWAAEAMLNNADGYYGGYHNFFIYDQGAAGVRVPAQDTDATFDWLAHVRSDGRRPITRCSGGSGAPSRRRRPARTG